MNGKKRQVEDVISAALNDVAKPVNPRHVHVFRKEYRKCMINGCSARKTNRADLENRA